MKLNAIKDIIEDVKDAIDDIISLPRRTYIKLRRSLDFAIMGYNNYEWDHHYLNKLVLFKLKRFHKAFTGPRSMHSPDCDNYKVKMKSLVLAIKIGEKVVNGEYMRFYDLHGKKWGESKTWTTPMDKDHKDLPEERSDEAEFFRMHSSRPNANTAEEKEMEHREVMLSLAKDHREEQRDIELLYRIVGKYNQYWWD